ncbi:MAG: type II secretion system GspH family protein [Saccharofermentans sp.]|nr:type II secretion system GspH family protein [Saccharofermentans sp.]
MKKLIKIRKTGFTLVETMLAVVIMVITSSMLMNGFLATMGYAYHTSVYTRSAGNNYATCINSVADLHAMGEEDRHRQAELNTRTGGGATAATLSFTGGVTSLTSLKIGVTSSTNNTSALPDTVTGVASEGDLKLDNRHSFFYYPTVNSNSASDDTYLGRTRIYKKSATGEWWWCYIDDTTGNIVEICKVS